MFTERQMEERARYFHDLIQRSRAEGQLVGREEMTTALTRSEHLTAELCAEGTSLQQYYAQQFTLAQQQYNVLFESMTRAQSSPPELQGEIDVRDFRVN